ncbi:SRPBCC domain-containing protein [Shewanella sp.]|uniref:SRPBCC family protein n=1 Tax=Shewanella sp. TaxID=50422 RepID=UPI001ECC62AB|nr:SRPBCC domain-containing protein [Shewanella sp.]
MLNRELIFTWRWEDSPNTTLVTVLFSAIDECKSHLTLVHSEFVEQALRERHLMGWKGCLDNLNKAKLA